MKLASFCLNEFKHFDPIGLKFTATSKRLGSEQVYFWIPPINEKKDRLFRWIPQSSSWKECSISGLSEKKRFALLECWKNQSDIGLWMSQSRQLSRRRAA